MDEELVLAILNSGLVARVVTNSNYDGIRDLYLFMENGSFIVIGAVGASAGLEIDGLNIDDPKPSVAIAEWKM